MISVVLALLTSASNATAAVLQRRAASQARASRPLELSLIGDLIRRRVWLAGIGMVIVASLLQAGALATGPIALVQPIFIVELPLTLLLSSLVWHRRLAPRTWGAVALVTVSLGTGLAAAQPSGGVDHAPSTSRRSAGNSPDSSGRDICPGGTLCITFARPGGMPYRWVISAKYELASGGSSLANKVPAAPSSAAMVCTAAGRLAGGRACRTPRM